MMMYNPLCEYENINRGLKHYQTAPFSLDSGLHDFTIFYFQEGTVVDSNLGAMHKVHKHKIDGDYDYNFCVSPIVSSIGANTSTRNILFWAISVCLNSNCELPVCRKDCIGIKHLPFQGYHNGFQEAISYTKMQHNLSSNALHIPVYLTEDLQGDLTKHFHIFLKYMFLAVGGPALLLLFSLLFYAGTVFCIPDTSQLQRYSPVRTIS
mmetsp:Transcript_10664/g.13835  ORF Transcript_10664/g.13835 Transcript_10664/m.13835 type:complete len:208 (+) Transcript_10664:2-625(+)